MQVRTPSEIQPASQDRGRAGICSSICRSKIQGTSGTLLKHCQPYGALHL
ncbi:hypothetical protein OIU77_007287 [Salix suchowensis]|uniref:Uncharacterized protein n=1 Tax=Salix suchowensis TaxID=1278906 RepID=A0ABQ9AGI5_9ROSI|nr:hypothetical protein OIU77_007287 [Salix suchowensis]